MAGKSFTFKVNGHLIKVEIGDTGSSICYDEKSIHRSDEPKAKVQFHVDENGEEAFYDINISLDPNLLIQGYRNKAMVFRR